MWQRNCNCSVLSKHCRKIFLLRKDRCMRILTPGRLSMFVLLAFVSSAAAQDAHVSRMAASASDLASVPSKVETTRSAPSSFDEVVDRVVEREHLLLAQMHDLRPVVETYLQNLKSDGNGNASPVNDQYFLGRLDMSDGPEGISFVGEQGPGQSRLNKLTGIFSLHFQPLGFAQMVVPDTDFNKTNYIFSFVRREF